MFEWMFGNGWDSPGWTFPDSGEGTFKLCSATLGGSERSTATRATGTAPAMTASDTEHFPITWTITFVSSVFNQYTRNGWNEYEGEFAADGDDTVFALAPTTRSTATSHTAISWTTCPLPRKAATAATS